MLFGIKQHPEYSLIKFSNSYLKIPENYPAAIYSLCAALTAGRPGYLTEILLAWKAQHQLTERPYAYITLTNIQALPRDKQGLIRARQSPIILGCGASPQFHCS